MSKFEERSWLVSVQSQSSGAGARLKNKTVPSTYHNTAECLCSSQQLLSAECWSEGEHSLPSSVTLHFSVIHPKPGHLLALSTSYE